MKKRLYLLAPLCLLLAPGARAQLSVGSTGTLYVGSGATLSVNGALQNAGTVTNAGTIALRGDLQNTAIFTSTDGHLTLDGSAAQTLTSSSGLSVKNLTVNNTTAGEAVTLAAPLTVGGVGTFTDGILKSDATHLLAFADGASVSGASDASHAKGPVQKTGAAAFVFPLGNGTAYRPASVAPQSGAATDAFTAEYKETDPGNTASKAVCLASVSGSEHWQVERTAGSASAVVGLAYQNVATSVGNPDRLRVVRYGGSAWEALTCADDGGQANGLVTTNGPTANFGLFTLGSVLDFSLGGSQTNVGCHGGNTGSATVTVSGGTAPYTYSWSPAGGTGPTASGLTAGTYTVTVTDANGNFLTREFTITQPDALTTTGWQANVACFGGSTGSATVTASGGTPEYTYAWAPSGGSNATASGLTAGTYTVTVTDANGCITTRDFTILSPGSFTVDGSQTNVSCFGGSTGSATATPSGGTGPYTYSWSPSGGTSFKASGLSAGEYTVTVTDANGCFALRTFTLTEPPTLTASAVANPASVCLNATLTLSATAGGGTGTLAYAWSGPNDYSASTNPATRTVGANDGGVYSVMVKDENGCTTSASTAPVTVLPAVAITSLTPSQAVCPQVPFTLTVEATGQNLTYQWYRYVNGTNDQLLAGATSASLTVNLNTSANYYVVVKTTCGSLTSDVVRLTLKAPTTLRTTGNPNAVCTGGNVTLSASASGPGSLSFAWRKGSADGPVVSTASSLTIQNAQSSDAGPYFVSVTSECTTVTAQLPLTVRSVTITQQPPASVNLCSGTTTLTVGVQAVGVTPTYQWRRNGQNILGATSSSHVVAASRPGTYTVVVSSFCGNPVTSEASVVGCGNGRLSAETAAMVVAPNPVRGREIRLRVSGMDDPELSLSSGAGRSIGLSVKTDGTGEFVLTPKQALLPGVYVVGASEGTLRLSQRVLVVE